MSTPEEQQRRQYAAQQQSQQQQQQSQQSQSQQEPVDPYGTQTWQADTWDTTNQPALPPLGAVPGQPVAPEGWFRDEPAAPAAPAAAGAPAPWPDGSAAGPAAEAYPSYGYPAQAAAPAGQPAWGAAQEPYPGPQEQQQAVAPEGWFRDEVPAQSQSQAPAPAQDWSLGGQGLPGPGAEPPQAPAAEQTAYLPPYPGPQEAQQQSVEQPVAPQGWFRDEVPAQSPSQVPAPAQYWSLGGQGLPGPGVGEQQPQGSAAEQTAYLPPFPGPEAQQQGSAAEAGRPAPYPAAGQEPQPLAAEQTAYLPPFPGPGERPQGSAAEQTAYLPPFPGPEAQPQGSAAEQTAYLPPVPGPEAQSPQGAAAAPAAGEDAAWSPPTLGGNTLRAVDPAQARAEGRSPIIDPGPQPAILTAALGLLLAAAAALGQFALLVPLIALQALTAAGWFRLNGMWPARQGIALAFAGALVADVAVLAVDPLYGAGAIVGTLGAWVLITLVLQLRSRAEPDERMYGLMASVASAALAIVCAGFLAADSAAVTVGAAAVAVAVFVRALPLPTPASVGVSLASAAGAGVAVGGLTSVGVGGALVGLAAGVCALVGLRVAAYDYPSKFVHMTAGVALPLAAAAPAVYLIGRVVG
ncbi:hypothetical protein [Streptomyces sp. NPDC008265]|uniref:hypothetical protein n=1 Tax=Streptomyces sp. NPDC008265 TaxID=3364824 RepID=UPI0036E238A8